MLSFSKFFVTVVTLASAPAVMLASVPAFAQSQNIEIPYTGAAIQESLDLKYDQMKDVYESRTIPKTCYEKVQVGSHQECRDNVETECGWRSRQICEGTPRVCRQVNEQICGPVHRQYCDNVPDYQDRAYDCSTVEQVKVGTTLDYTVQANVKLNVDASAGAATSRLSVLLANGYVSARVAGDNSRLFLSSSKVVSKNESDKLKSYNYEINLHVIDVAALFAPIKTKLVVADTATNMQVSATLGEVSYPEFLEITYSLVRPKVEGEQFDKVLYSAKLKDGEYTLSQAADGLTTITVDVTKLKTFEPVSAGQQLITGFLVRVPTEKLQSSLNPEVIQNHNSAQSARVPITLQ